MFLNVVGRENYELKPEHIITRETCRTTSQEAHETLEGYYELKKVMMTGQFHFHQCWLTGKGLVLLTANHGLLTANCGLLTANHCLLTANSGLLTANRGLLTANHGLLTANHGLLTANRGLLTATVWCSVLSNVCVECTLDSQCRRIGHSLRLEGGQQQS